MGQVFQLVGQFISAVIMGVSDGIKKNKALNAAFDSQTKNIEDLFAQGQQIQTDAEGSIRSQYEEQLRRDELFNNLKAVAIAVLFIAMAIVLVWILSKNKVVTK